MRVALLAFRLVCLAWLWPVSSHYSNKRRHKEPYGENTKQKHGGRVDLKMKKMDSTKSLLIKSEQLLRIEDHDFAMRPGFGGSAIPVGIDVQVESIDSISEVNMDFTMTLYLRHYWQDDRLAFPSSSNKSRTFDARLVKKIWVPDVFFVHSKRSFIHDTTMENIMLRVFPDGNILYSVRITVTALCSMDFSSFPLDTQNCSLELESCITTVLTMSTIITGVSASMPQVSYVKAVDIYLWASFLFVFLSVIEYAAVNYFTTVEEMKKLKRAKIPNTFDATEAMAFDGCFHDNDIDMTSFTEVASTPNTERNSQSRNSTVSGPAEGTRLRRKNPVKQHFSFIMSNSYMIDSYSRVIFPMAYLLFNIIYWSLYA
ncbi:gamma-aminobutyric acid receptor subunit rho-3a isoform 4-T5 [Spinachia spinachia]